MKLRRLSIKHSKDDANKLIDLIRQADPEACGVARQSLAVFAHASDEEIASSIRRCHVLSVIAQEAGYKRWSDFVCARRASQRSAARHRKSMIAHLRRQWSAASASVSLRDTIDPPHMRHFRELHERSRAVVEDLLNVRAMHHAEALLQQHQRSR